MRSMLFLLGLYYLFGKEENERKNRQKCHTSIHNTNKHLNLNILQPLKTATVQAGVVIFSAPRRQIKGF